MEWFVYHYNINKHEIEAFNIFKHGSFAKYCNIHLNTMSDKEQFANAIKDELRYYFWSKSEYELIVRLTDDDRVFLLPWCGSRNPEGEKLEVANETNFDWLGFAKQHIGKQIYKNEAKIDVSDQVRFQFDEFIDYMWSCKAR